MESLEHSVLTELLKADSRSQGWTPRLMQQVDSLVDFCCLNCGRWAVYLPALPQQLKQICNECLRSAQ